MPKTTLEKKFLAWCERHPNEKQALTGFLCEYGVAIPEQGTLNEVLTRAYTEMAEKRGVTLEKLLDWIFVDKAPANIDLASYVAARMQVMTG